jgi:hypothetical protein
MLGLRAQVYQREAVLGREEEFLGAESVSHEGHKRGTKSTKNTMVLAKKRNEKTTRNECGLDDMVEEGNHLTITPMEANDPLDEGWRERRHRHILCGIRSGRGKGSTG